jgi:predicted Zn-ribbon and HTH transcriptional regulator
MDQSHDLSANSQFYDDSSSALGLGYSPTSVTITSAHPDDKEIVPSYTPAERAQIEHDREAAAKAYQAKVEPLHKTELALAADRPEPERDPKGNVIPFNRGAYADWNARARELEAAGVPAAEAQRIARTEIRPDVPDAPKKPDPYAGTSMESLMARRVDVRGGSRSGRKFGEPKRGSKMCRKCGLERKVCGCYSGRNDSVTARVTTATKDAISQTDVSAGEILEAVVEAAAAIGGAHRLRTLLRVLKRMDKALVLRDPACANCTSLPEGMVCPNCALQWQMARGIA